jgi:deoxyribodipyrimidine photolyase-related protein
VNREYFSKRLEEMKTLRLILGDQLNHHHSWFRDKDKDIVYVMMEVRQETDNVLHHVQKVLSVFAAMRRFADYLRSTGNNVIYLKISDPDNLQNLNENLSRLVKVHDIDLFQYQLPDEYRLEEQLRELCKKLSVRIEVFDSEHFLTKRHDLQQFFSERYLMESFYRWMRKKTGVLMEDVKPEGGKWNYDVMNRSEWSGQRNIPQPLLFENDCSEIHREAEASGVKFFGKVDPSRLIWPVTRKQALDQLEHFVTFCLQDFGTFQDSMTRHSWSLFHSRLSFTLNFKLLHPLEVIQRALKEWGKRKGEIGISQIEGFVRQIMGWREYIRGIYWAFMPDYQKCNFFHTQRKLPEYYWTANTRMECMRFAIQQSLNRAYAHHIQRLMVTGNFGLLSGVSTDEIDRWYLGIYIDAVQWVEITNTRGMSQYADGGIIATKPYAASAHYISRMSDYCETCFYEKRRIHGEKSCPFNSLYWNFFHQNRTKLEKNPRLKLVFRGLDRKSKDEKRNIFSQARFYLHNLEDL